MGLKSRVVDEIVLLAWLFSGYIDLPTEIFLVHSDCAWPASLPGIVTLVTLARLNKTSNLRRH